MSPRSKKRGPALTDAEKAVLHALAAAGVSPVIARRMLADKGDRWCRQLLAYGRWQRAHASVGGGWYYRTWQEWVAWPDAFIRRWEREEAAARRVQRAPHRPAHPAPPAHPARPAAGEGTAAAPAGDPLAAALAALAALPEADRLALADQARAELRRDLPGAAFALIERLAPARMRLLLQRRQSAPPPPDLPDRPRPA